MGPMCVSQKCANRRGETLLFNLYQNLGVLAPFKSVQIVEARLYFFMLLLQGRLMGHMGVSQKCANRRGETLLFGVAVDAFLLRLPLQCTDVYVLFTLQPEVCCCLECTDVYRMCAPAV